MAFKPYLLADLGSNGHMLAVYRLQSVCRHTAACRGLANRREMFMHNSHLARPKAESQVEEGKTNGRRGEQRRILQLPGLGILNVVLIDSHSSEVSILLKL